MSLKDKVNKVSRRPSALVILAIVVALAVIATIALKPGETETAGSYYTVRRGDFLISVVEPGTLQAVNEVMIRNEVEGTARVIYIVPEGTYVKKGDLLVELDSAAAQDQVNQQLISVQKAEFAYIQAEEQLAIQKSVVDSEVRAADLKLKFAEMDLKKFNEGEAMQEMRKARNEIVSLEQKMAIDKERRDWSIKLAEDGFETKSNRDRDELTYLQTQLSLQMATNAAWMLEQYDLPKKRETYASAVLEAEKELERVKHQGNRKIAQFEADLRTQEITLQLSKSKLERDQRNLAAARIIAPQDGLVVYSVSENRFSNESLIEEGATVRNRQTLIKLPDVSSMKLSIKIHETHINMISPGQPAYIVLDSMPDQRFRGRVSKVGLLPDTTSRWGNPNLKVYATEVLVTDKLPAEIKPGVSASAEVVITNLQNVISVPIQAVTTRQGRQVVYVLDGDKPRPVNVEVGLYNTKFIEIVSGLKEGDRILLAPPFDTRQKDLDGSILNGEEELLSATNQMTMVRPDEGAAAIPVAARGVMEGSGPGAGPVPGMRPPGGADERQASVPGEAQAGEIAGRPGSRGGERPNFDELRKQYDKDGDGELNDEERQAMRTAMQERFGQGGGRRRGGGEGMNAGENSGGENGGSPRGERRNRGPRAEGGEGPVQ